MPDKDPDVGPLNPRPNKVLHPEPPPSLKHWGRLAATAVIVIAVLGIGWRLWDGRNAAQSAEDQSVPTVQVIKIKTPRTAAILRCRAIFRHLPAHPSMPRSAAMCRNGSSTSARM